MTTVTHYLTDAAGVYIRSVEASIYAAIPRRATLTPPPDAPIVRWAGGAWEVLDSYPEPPAPDTPDPAAQRAAAKQERETRVSEIRVTTTAGNTFDGDEVSQGRMVRAIVALQATGTPSITWVLADNTAIEATAAELTEALALAGAAQAAIWVLPS